MTPPGADPDSQTRFRAQTPAEPAKPTAGGAAPPEASPGATAFRVRERIAPAAPTRPRWNWRRTATHPVLSSGLALIGASIIGWSMLFRLPDDALRTVHASEVMNRQPHLGENRTALSEEAIERLRGRVREARAYLVQDRDELVKLVAETERLAMESGWRAEVSLQPAQPAPPGLDRAQWHPAEVMLANLAGNTSDRRAYLRLLDFMGQVKALGKKIELTGLNLKAGPDGLQTAQATIVIWSALSHEDPAAR